jgi:hypothetical protein
VLTDIPQALEGKDVKDLLINVGSGGGAAAVASSGAPAAGGAAAPEEAKEEEKKEEGKYSVLFSILLVTQANAIRQKRKSQTRIWVSDFSTKRLLLFLSVLAMHGSVFRPSVQYLLGLAASIERASSYDGTIPRISNLSLRPRDTNVLGI